MKNMRYENDWSNLGDQFILLGTDYAVQSFYREKPLEGKSLNRNQ